MYILDYFKEFEENNKKTKDTFEVEVDERALRNKQSELLSFFKNPLGIIYMLISLVGIVALLLFFIQAIPLYFKVNTGIQTFLSLIFYVFITLVYLIISMVSLYVFVQLFISSLKKDSLTSGSLWGFLYKFTHIFRIVLLFGCLFILLMFTFGISPEGFFTKLLIFMAAYGLILLSFTPVIHFESDLSVAYNSLYKRIPRAKMLLLLNIVFVGVSVLLLYEFHINNEELLFTIFNRGYALEYLYIGTERIARYLNAVESIKNLMYLSLAAIAIKHLYTFLYLLIYNKRFVNTNLYLEQDIKRVETMRKNQL